MYYVVVWNEDRTLKPLRDPCKNFTTCPCGSWSFRRILSLTTTPCSPVKSTAAWRSPPRRSVQEHGWFSACQPCFHMMACHSKELLTHSIWISFKSGGRTSDGRERANLGIVRRLTSVKRTLRYFSLIWNCLTAQVSARRKNKEGSTTQQTFFQQSALFIAEVWNRVDVCCCPVMGLFCRDSLIFHNTCTHRLFTFNKSEAGKSCLCWSIVDRFGTRLLVFVKLKGLWCKTCSPPNVSNERNALSTVQLYYFIFFRGGIRVE